MRFSYITWPQMTRNTVLIRVYRSDDRYPPGLDLPPSAIIKNRFRLLGLRSQIIYSAWLNFSILQIQIKFMVWGKMTWRFRVRNHTSTKINLGLSRIKNASSKKVPSSFWYRRVATWNSRLEKSWRWNTLSIAFSTHY